MAELEEARLPHKLEELADCPAEDIVRALRRDHRYLKQKTVLRNVSLMIYLYTYVRPAKKSLQGD